MIMQMTNEFDDNTPTKDHFLGPGELVFGDHTLRVTTVLGSCVSVTLWHPKRLIGGMCHIVLPSSDFRSGSALRRPEGYYGDQAFKWLESQAAQHGAKMREFETKIFGGSNALDMPGIAGVQNIGDKNIQAAFHQIAHYRLRLVAHDVGNNGSRKISFNISTGDVWMKHQKFI
jgi:chemotaxis protein CheD